MGAALDGGTIPATDEDDGLVEILAAHNVKEEGILYPMIDRQSTADERERVFSNMALDS